MKDIKGALKGVCIVYVLLHKASEVASSIPLEVRPLLEEFKVVFPTDLPVGLLPMRDI